MIAREARRAVVSLVGAVLITGCSTIQNIHSDLHVQLAYGVASVDQTPLNELKPMTVAIRVEDQRDANQRDRVGDRINSFGAVLAKIVPKPDPIEAMRSALQTQFENNGFRVVAVDDTNSPTADALVTVAVKKYWGEAKMHFVDVEMVGTVSADVTVSSVKNPAITFTKTISGSRRTGAQVVDDGDYQGALNCALREFIYDFSFDPAIARALRQARGE